MAKQETVDWPLTRLPYCIKDSRLATATIHGSHQVLIRTAIGSAGYCIEGSALIKLGSFKRHYLDTVDRHLCEIPRCEILVCKASSEGGEQAISKV